MSKQKSFQCDCCGEDFIGAPFAQDVKATTWVGRKRFDLEYEDCCESCALALGLATLRALNALGSEPQGSLH